MTDEISGGRSSEAAFKKEWEMMCPSLAITVGKQALRNNYSLPNLLPRQMPATQAACTTTESTPPKQNFQTTQEQRTPSRQMQELIEVAPSPIKKLQLNESRAKFLSLTLTRANAAASNCIHKRRQKVRNKNSYEVLWASSADNKRYLTVSLIII